MHHDFILLKRSIVDNENKFEKVTTNYFNNNKDDIPFVQIEDDLIVYMIDTFKWFETLFHNKEKHKSIAYHGISIFKDENAEKAQKIFDAWRNLFFLGDETINLTGEYLFAQDKVDEQGFLQGQYEEIKLNRDETLKKLQTLVDLLEEAKVDSKFCVVHFGL